MNLNDIDLVLRQFGSWLGDGALIGAFAFVLSYGFFFNWRKTRAGRAIMAFVSALVALTLLSWIFRTFPNIDPFVYGAIRFVLLGYVFAASWGMFITLWKTWTRTPIDGLEANEKHNDTSPVEVGNVNHD